MLQDILEACDHDSCVQPNARTRTRRTAMGNNIRLVRASLCHNPWLMARIAFYGTGLGTK